VGSPLRGELTRAPHAVRAPAIDTNLEAIGGVLSHVVRLALPMRHQTPTIVVSDAPDEPPDAGAPWAWTAAEVATTQGALLSWLIHLAAAANDVRGLEYCLSTDAAGGIVNWINPASGRSPLHVAAINGGVQSVRTLLEAGALVHLRDSLGHTALYYAARQGQDEIVSMLVSAGANLGGADVEGFASLAVKRALFREDDAALKIWKKAGIRIPDREQQQSRDSMDP